MELGELIKQVSGMLKLIIHDEEIIPLVAVGIAKMHQELCDRGFSRSEALQIICAVSQTSSRK